VNSLLTFVRTYYLVMFRPGVSSGVSVRLPSVVFIILLELPRELECLSTRYVLFPLTNFHFRLHFLQSVDELLEFMVTWSFAISLILSACQPGNRSKHMHVD